MQLKTILKYILIIFIINYAIIILFPFVIKNAHADDPWYNTSWAYRKQHTINPAIGAGTGYQVKIVVHYGSGIDSGGDVYLSSHSRGDFADVTFTDNSGNTPLSYWQESETNNVSATYWVKINADLSSSSNYLYIYYGNLGQTVSGSNGTNTFLFFDDFSGDLSKWNIDPENTDAVSIYNGYLRQNPDSSQTKNQYFDTRLMAKNFTMTDAAISYKVYLAGPDREISQLGFRVDSLSLNSGYAWRNQDQLNDGGFFEFSSGSWSQLGATEGPVSANTWYQVEIHAVGSNLQTFVNGSLVESITDSTNTSGGLISHVHGVNLTSSDYVLISNVYVRKLVSSEPTQGAWGTEQTTSAPSSSSFMLDQFGFGAGGIVIASSSNYMLQGIVGELETASPSSNGYILWPGLLYTMQPAVPPTPAFVNPAPGNNYNILNLTINQGSNLSDTNYAIAVSTDPNFLTNVQYVQSNNTLGAIIFWQSYTSWWATGGAASGTNIIGLTPGTTYYARVQANRGTFTQETYSGVSSAATVNPTFTFLLQTTNQAVPPYTIGIGVINPGQVTTSWQKIIATITTNADTGGTVYINDANAGLKSASSGNHVIATVQNDLSSGGVTEGYGARGVSVSSSVGNMELLSPYNLGGNNVGPVGTSKNAIADSTSAPVTSGTVNFELKAKAGTSTPAATDYADIITVVASGSF
jgi:hypothetical protein